MTNRDFTDPRPTEQRNPRTERIDVASSLEIVDLMNAEDAEVAGLVRGERERIARAIDLLVDAIQIGRASCRERVEMSAEVAACKRNVNDNTMKLQRRGSAVK